MERPRYDDISDYEEEKYSQSQRTTKTIQVTCMFYHIIEVQDDTDIEDIVQKVKDKMNTQDEVETFTVRNAIVNIETL